MAVRARLAGRPNTKPIMPITVARFAALARASSLAAAVVTGAWAGVLLYTAPRGSPTRRSPGPTRSRRRWGSFPGCALLAAALWLEQGCRAAHDAEALPSVTPESAPIGSYPES